MDHSMIRAGLIILGLIAILLVAVRFNLFSQNGVRHMHRYYYGLLMQMFLYVLFLTKIAGELYVNAHIVTPLGCIAGFVLYLLSKSWFNRHFDGELISMEPRRIERYILAFAFCMLCIYGFNVFKPYAYGALGVVLIAWTLSSTLFMVHLWKLEKKLGHPILEREAIPSRAAN